MITEKVFILPRILNLLKNGLYADLMKLMAGFISLN